MEKRYLFAGIGRATLRIESFDLGHGVFLRQTCAYLMSPFLMAFSPAEPEKPHPPPWRSARGGLVHDITMELCIPEEDASLPGGLTAEETVWWIVALLRLAYYPFLVVPVLSDQSFSVAAHSKTEPNLRPFETEHRIFARLAVWFVPYKRTTWRGYAPHGATAQTFSRRTRNLGPRYEQSIPVQSAAGHRHHY